MEEAMVDDLPSYQELVGRFSLFGSAPTSCNTQIGANGSLFCNCKDCLHWRRYVEGLDPQDSDVKYEVFTRDHVSGLAHYLRARAVEYELSPMDVLEVGAGSGRLSRHLNRTLSQLFIANQGPVVIVTATDNGVRHINGPLVEKQDAVQAISTRNAHIVISSWMPRGLDWTCHMRAMFSVCEYILIGEIDYGICGCPWQTWGFSSSWDSSESGNNDSDHVEIDDLEREVCSQQSPNCSGDSQERKRQKCCAGFPENSLDLAQSSQSLKLTVVGGSVGDEEKRPTASWNRICKGTVSPVDTKYNKKRPKRQPQYEIDGWERVELERLSNLQVCRTDERWSTTRHSHTVSFRRIVEHSSH